jgi:hypothetical protein
VAPKCEFARPLGLTNAQYISKFIEIARENLEYLAQFCDDEVEFNDDPS